MNSVLPREEEVEAIFSQILASPDSCKKLMDVFYDVMDDNHLLEADNPKHFSKVLFYAYQNGDISALLLKLCGKSMFDLLREAYLIPKRFHGKAGKNPVLLTNPEGELLPEAQKIVSGREYSKFKETYKIIFVLPVQNYISQMVMTLSVLMLMTLIWKLRKKEKINGVAL